MSISDNVRSIRQRIEQARVLSPRPDVPVSLVVVSKHHSAEEVLEAKATGLEVFAENRVQELLPKAEALADDEVVFHLIGHLQTNKVRQVIDRVQMIQSLDSRKLAEEIEKRAAQKELVMDVLVQVNMAGETQKYGMAPDDVLDFLHAAEQFPHLHIRGLMFIAPNEADKEDVRPYFKKMYALFTEVRTLALPHVDMTWLSMGMSGDFETAIEEGANMVRIGSAVFE